MTSTVDVREARQMPVAPAWHTATLVAILIAIAIRGAMFQAASGSASAPRMPTYMSLTVAELLLLYFVRTGIRRKGLRPLDLIGGRWANARDIAADVARGVGLWGLLSIVSIAWTRWLPQFAHAKSISPLLPQSP